MTQPLFDPEHWHAFVKRLGGQCPIPVLLGIWPLTSYKQALRLNNEVPGIVIPEPVLKEMEAAGASAREHGFALAQEDAGLGAHGIGWRVFDSLRSSATRKSSKYFLDLIGGVTPPDVNASNCEIPRRPAIRPRASSK